MNRRSGDEDPEPRIISGRLPEHVALVHQAAGFVGAGLGLAPDDALRVLEREAQRLGIDLSVLAADIVERRRPLPSAE